MEDETIKEMQEEIDRLKDKCDTQANILRKAFPEKSGHYFICGEAGEQDEMGLPDYIHICPAYGLDGMATYKKIKDYSAPGW